MKELSRRTLLAGATALGATAIAPGSVAPVRAAAPPAGKQAAAFYRYKVGDFEITAINDGVWLPDVAQNLVRNATVEDMKKALAEQFQSTEKLHVPFTPLMVNTGSKLVLIDTGSAGMFVPTAANFLANLTAAGFDPKQVDTVVISHFHGDHINGIRTKDGQLVFPNAEVMVPAPEWAHWMDDAKMNAAPEADTQVTSTTPDASSDRSRTTSRGSSGARKSLRASPQLRLPVTRRATPPSRLPQAINR